MNLKTYCLIPGRTDPVPCTEKTADAARFFPDYIIYYEDLNDPDGVVDNDQLK